MNLVNKGKQLLLENSYTLVALKDDEVYSSSRKGIEAIMAKVLVSKRYFADYIVVKRVVGKSAAMLLIRSNIKALHAFVLSIPAKQLLDSYQVPYSYDKLVPLINDDEQQEKMAMLDECVAQENDLDVGFWLLFKKMSDCVNRR